MDEETTRGTFLLNIEAIESEHGLDNSRGDWEDLHARSASDNVFLSFDWARAWLRHLGAGRRLVLLVLRDESRVRAIVPWSIGYAWRGRLPIRTLQFLGTGLSDRLDILTTAEPEDVLEASIRYLESRAIGWDVIDLREIPTDSPTIDAIAKVAPRLGIASEIVDDSTCPYLSIDTDWESYFSSRFGREMRRQIRRKARRLQRSGSARFSILESIPEGTPWLGRLAALPQDGTYLGERRNSIFSSPSKRAFFEEVSTRFSERRWLHLGLLEVNGEVAAYRLSFLFAGKYFDYVTGFHRDLAALSPGSALLTHVIEDCFRRGLREVDFLRGTEKWKSIWTDEHRPQARALLYRPGPRGTLAKLLARARTSVERRISP